MERQLPTRLSASLKRNCILLVSLFLLKPASFLLAGPINFDVTRTTGAGYVSIVGAGGLSATGWRNSNNTDDNLSIAQNIGFSFNYGGLNYTQFLVSTNGFITFNIATPSIGNLGGAYGYSNGSVSNAPYSTLVLAPFYDDLVCQGNPNSLTGLSNSIKYMTTGTTGNRILTIEWTGMETFGNSGPNLNFQVKLYEGTNVIEYVYGVMEGFNGTQTNSYSYSLGMNAASLSPTPLSGELFNQLTANTKNFGTAPSSFLDIVPQCSTMLHFTVGAYLPVAVVNTPPVNDLSTSPLHLNVNPALCTEYCGTYYSSAYATGQATGDCSGVPDDDVWFEFTATYSNITIRVGGSTNYNAVVELYNSASVLISCVNSAPASSAYILNASSLVLGQQYKVRVYNGLDGWGANMLCNGQFSICVGQTTAPPSNDSCGLAISLPVSSQLVLTTGIQTSTATASPGVPLCSATGNPDDDVWYKFTALKSTETINVVAGNGYDPVVQLFSGACGSLSSISCVNLVSTGQSETLTATTLFPNSTYYIRVFHAGSGGATGSYSIGITAPVIACPTTLIPATATQNIPTSGTQLSWSKVTGATSYKVLLDTVNPPTHFLPVTTDTFALTGPVVAGFTYYWSVLPADIAGYAGSCQINAFAPVPVSYDIRIKVFLEGLYKGSGQMNASINPADTIADTITVSLVNSNYDVLYSDKALLTTSGLALAYFPQPALQRSYFISVKHRNSVEVWSNGMFTFNDPDTIYDFTTNNLAAYAGNMIQLSPGLWGLHYGDINQDGFVNIMDFNLINNGVTLFENGYKSDDINGDRIVESIDYSMIENKLPLSVRKKTPQSP